MASAYLTSQDIAQQLAELSEEISALKSQARRMKMSRVDLVRLQDGDLLVLRIQRPLATSEQQMVVDGFKQLFAKLGKNVELAVVCGHDEVKMEVVRAA